MKYKVNPFIVAKKMKKTAVFLLVIVCTLNTLSAQKRIDHMVWDQLLLLNVSNQGEVDYKGFIRDKFLFYQYFASLSVNFPDIEYSQAERLAYWVNLYNAAVMKMIIDHYPVTSINDIENPWKRKVVTVNGTSYSLDDIEHTILRKMNEPRVHFVLNCAAKSSPKLWNRAYTGANIYKELEAQTKLYINDSRKNILSKQEIQVSQVFEWYKKDFNNGNIVEFIKKYTDKSIPKNTKVSYLPYNWELYERN